MTARRQRLLLLLASLTALAIAIALVLGAFRRNLVFFFTPSQVYAGDAPRHADFRVGGLVQAGSVVHLSDGLTVRFTVTDQVRRVTVQYAGLLPDLFSEGKGVVAQGRLTDAGMFVADQVLAKHDEQYMPPEAAYALKRAQRSTGEVR